MRIRLCAQRLSNVKTSRRSCRRKRQISTAKEMGLPSSYHRSDCFTRVHHIRYGKPSAALRRIAVLPSLIGRREDELMEYLKNKMLKNSRLRGHLLWACVSKEPILNLIRFSLLVHPTNAKLSEAGRSIFFSQTSVRKRYIKSFKNTIFRPIWWAGV